MFKKMLISMMIMSVSLIGGMLFFLQFSEGATLDSLDFTLNGDLVKSFDNEDYLYYLSEEEIKEAIEKGTTSLELIENYLLPPKSLEKNDNIAFAYIETPYLTVIKESRAIFDHYGRIPGTKELVDRVSDSYIPIHIRYLDNKGYVKDVSIKQSGEEIAPIHTETRGDGTMQTIYVNTADIDFSSSATVDIQDGEDPLNEVAFEINFKNYIQ